MKKFFQFAFVPHFISVNMCACMRYVNPVDSAEEKRNRMLQIGVNSPTPSGLNSRVVRLLDWLESKTREPSLCCYSAWEVWRISDVIMSLFSSGKEFSKA